MANKSLESSSLKEIYSSNLSSKFVFYERLAESRNPNFSNLYPKIKDKLSINFLNNESQNIGEIASYLAGVAKAERSKEEKLISKFFPDGTVNLDSIFGNKSKSVTSENNRKAIELVEFINLMFSEADFMQRAIYYLQYTEGQASTTTFINSYLMKTFEKFFNKENIEATVKKYFSNVRLNTTKNIEEEIEKIIHEILDDAMKETLKIMSNLDVQKTLVFNTFNEAAQEKIQKGIQYLNTAFEKLNKNRQNEYVRLLLQNQNLGNVEQMAKDLIKRKTKYRTWETFLKTNLPKQIKAFLKKDERYNYGTGQEIIGGMFAEGSLLEQLKKIKTKNTSSNGNNITFSIEHTGKFNHRTDMMYYIDVEGPSSNDFAKEWNNNIRKEQNKSELKTKIGSMDFFEKYEKQLSAINEESFLIHTSSKYYKVNSNFGGYKTIRNLRIPDLEQIIKRTNPAMNTTQFIAALMQLGDGAIGKKMTGLNDNISMVLAQFIAQIIFDDVQTLGTEMSATNVNSIHLLYLNNVYIPLSVFLYALSNAVSESANSKDYYKNYAQVNITVPKILYPEPIQITDKEHAEEELYAAWNEQRNYTINNTKINYYFLKNMKNFITELFDYGFIS